MQYYLIIGTNWYNSFSAIFNGKAYKSKISAINELYFIATEKEKQGYKVDVQPFNGTLLILDNEDMLFEIYNIYEVNIPE